MEAPLDPDIVTHAMKVERTAAQGNEPQAYTPATELKSLKPWTMLALAALGAVIISLWTWHWQMAMTAILLVSLTLGPLLRWWTLHRASCPLDHILMSFLGGLFLLSTVATITGWMFGSLVAIIVVLPISFIVGSWRLVVICDMIARWSAFFLWRRCGSLARCGGSGGSASIASSKTATGRSGPLRCTAPRRPSATPVRSASYSPAW